MTERFRTSVADLLFFKGRPGDPRVGEWVRKAFPPTSADSVGEPRKETIFIVGCADDTGVTLNRGRAGAQAGPDSIRRHLYKMTLPMDLEWEKYITLVDYGNVSPDKDIQETHRRVREITGEVGASGGTLIALGGGHDFAAPCFSGFAEGRGHTKKKKRTPGLINVDPHLDVRNLENDRPHSGTPFRQLLESKVVAGKNFVEFGARANRNAREYYDYCRERGVKIRTFEAIREKDGPAHREYRRRVRELSQRLDYVGATFDIDSCPDAEGMSAAPVVGFSAWEMCQMARAAGENRKVQYFEIAEVAPPLDPTERSSRIAAEMIYYFLRGRSESR